MRIKRDYQSWVANETLEDYALRYAASSYRRWSPATLANTAIGGISFLALEAIGASITLSFGFHNAFPAILVVCALIFLVSVPIAYYSSEANVDIDLLTRGAGFGYVGSTITSLIYASFTFIFFALEAAILAQALELAAGINIVIGYLLSSLLIIPLVFFGVTLINKLQRWTQPLWAVLLVAPFFFILWQDPDVLRRWAAFPGLGATAEARGGGIDVLLFGAAAGVLFSLMGQIGEQVDYLRFLPDRTARNRVSWWTAMLAAGPGWIVVGGLKLLAGSLLAVLALQDGLPAVDAVVPVHMYVTAYRHVFESPALALAVATVFVVISQVKINVTNAYAGSLAWSNVFARLTHYHPGRVVWLVFNVMIALLLTLLGIFKTLETVLSVYSNLVIAWLGALVADLVVLKPLGVSPKRIEFKRAHLYQVNPVGCGAMLIASVVSTCAFAGLFGDVARAYSAFIALFLAFVSAIAIAYATGGRYYIARADEHHATVPRTQLVRCCICERDYEAADMAWCPFNQGSICSLCCGLDNHCRDRCKMPAASHADEFAQPPGLSTLAPHFGRRIGRFFGLFVIASTATGAVFLLSYRLIEIADVMARAQIGDVLLHTYAATLPLLAFGAWWIVLSQESRELTQADLLQSLHNLEATRKELVESERMASLGGLVAGVAHEINTPVGIVVSAASYLRDRTESISESLKRQDLTEDALGSYLRDAGQSTRLMLSNADRAARLVQSFKQVAVDQVSEARRQFDLGEYIRETVLSVEPRLRGTRVALRIDCPPGILMDSFPGPLAQVLTNLILNSLVHAFAPGEVGHIVISARRSGEAHVVLEHEDDGCGIPDALHERIFEPFFTTRRGSGGSGLGLHLAYALATRALDGTLAVRNGARAGSVFVLTLPRVARARDGAIPGVPRVQGERP